MIPTSLSLSARLSLSLSYSLLSHAGCLTLGARAAGFEAMGSRGTNAEMSVADAEEAEALRECLSALEPLTRAALCSRGVLVLAFGNRGTRDWMVRKWLLFSGGGGVMDLG